MTRGALLGSALLLLSATAAPVAAQAPPAASMRNVERRIAFDDDGMLRIWNLTGAIRVVGWDRDSLVVTGAVPEDAEFHCGGARSAVKCGVDAPRLDDAAPGATLEVRVPRGAQVWLKTGSAGITISGMRGGDIDAYSVSGDIRVEGEARSLTLESMGGDVEVSGGARVARIRTASGGIRVVAGVEDLAVTTVSGAVRVEDAGVRRGRFESIEGDIAWSGAIQRGADLEFSSHGGEIRLALPTKTAVEVRIGTYQGTVANAFGNARLSDARDLAGKELNLSLGGGGGARVAIRNFKGHIALERR